MKYLDPPEDRSMGCTFINLFHAFYLVAHRRARTKVPTVESEVIGALARPLGRAPLFI